MRGLWDMDPGVGQGWMEDNASLVCSTPSERQCLEGFCSADAIPPSHQPHSLADCKALSPQLDFAPSEFVPELLAVKSSAIQSNRMKNAFLLVSVRIRP